MNKIIGIILVVVGVFLFIQGHNVSQSVNSQVKNLFTGTHVDQVQYYYLSGAVSAAVGLFLVFKPGKK
jgi:uncharacterized membrane protein